MIKKIIPSVLVLLILINSVGCYSYSQINKESAVLFKEDEKVKITTHDEIIYILYNVKIEELNLRGEKHTDEHIFGQYKRTKIDEVIIPTQQIKKIEVEKSDSGRTVLAVFLIVGIPIAVLAVIIGNQMAEGGYH